IEFLSVSQPTMTYRSTILFVEDESDLRDLVSEVLSAKGFEVLLASDGYETVRLLTEHHVDLLLTDVVMPGISGFELARQAKLMRPNLHVIYLSGQASGLDRKGPTYGVLVHKPLRAGELLEIIEREMGVGAA